MTFSMGFLRQTAKSILPDSARRTVKRAATLTRAASARLRLGFDVEPLSYVWGFDRGQPLHRYYLEQFLEEFRADIRGHCLEFRDDSYTHRYGGAAVAKLDILHLDDSHPAATIVADLTKPNDVPSNAFDCIVCTQVLHLIFEVDRAVSELWRILKPGGVLLATVPHISMCDPGWHEVWRFTPEGLGALVGKSFGSRRDRRPGVWQLADGGWRAARSGGGRVQQGDACLFGPAVRARGLYSRAKVDVGRGLPPSLKLRRTTVALAKVVRPRLGGPEAPPPRSLAL